MIGIWLVNVPLISPKNLEYRSDASIRLSGEFNASRLISTIKNSTVARHLLYVIVIKLLVSN